MYEDNFCNEEKLYRAVRPKIDLYIKDNGSITSAAFKSMNNEDLSVDRQMQRSNNEAVGFIAKYKEGYIVSITCENCWEKSINVKYDPVLSDDERANDPYHTVIYRDDERRTLSSSQAKHLSKCCVIELKR